MGLNLNEATINEFGRFDELKKSIDKTKAKAFFEAYEQTKLIPPKDNMKTDQLLRQFNLTGGFEVEERQGVSLALLIFLGNSVRLGICS